MRTLITFIVQKEIQHDMSNEVQDLIVRNQGDALRAQGWDIKLQDVTDDGRPWRPDGGDIMGNPIFQAWEMGPLHYADGSSVMHGPRPPCAFCGKKAGPQDHDPCIENLPGVDYACCGHGIREGYVRFSDARVIRGFFTAIEPGDGGPDTNFPAGSWAWLARHITEPEED